MAELIDVDDVADTRLDDFRNLSTADRRPDRPGGRGLVIAEGSIVVRRLLRSHYPVRALLGVPRRMAELDADLVGLDIPAYVSSADVMAEVVGFHLNRGVLAVADRAESSTPAQVIASARTLLVLEGVGDHENLGALFRNAAALAASGQIGVLLGPGCSDPLYRRSVRVSMGNVLRVPFAPLRPWPEALDWLRAQGFRVAALAPHPDSETVAGLAAAAQTPTALLLGTEGAGLSEQAIRGADHVVRVPMAGGVDSLNVATTAALACYELCARG